MNSFPRRIAALSFLLAGTARLSFAQYRTAIFPPAHELFSPLIADPTEPRFSFRLGVPVSHHGIARVDVGDYLGIFRIALNDEAAVQLNVGGAILTRFDATAAHNLQVLDFYGNVPIDFRYGPFSSRLMFYHDSSHLGDDYLREKNIQGRDNSWEALRGIFSVQAAKPLRLYAGYTDAVHTKPDWAGRQAVQAGAEIYFFPSSKGFMHPYLATDMQTWERSQWVPTWTYQLGFKTGDEYSRGRGISYFIEYKTGPRLEGQFFAQHESIWGIGLKFVLSDHLLQPAAPITPTPPPAPAVLPQ